MRTTLTIDDDVAAELERLQRERDMTLKELINDALRRGLREIRSPLRRREPFRTPTYSSGGALIPLDNVAEALARAEGEDFK